MRTPAKGAESTVWLASAPELEKETGKLWSIKKPMRESRIPPGWNDGDMAKRLVAEIDRLAV